MIKKGITIIIFWIAFVSQPSVAQQPVLSVQSFEYIKDADPKHWLNTPEAGWIKDSITKIIAHAIQQRWDILVPQFSLSMKPLGLFSLEPKFNTKLKDKQPGTWYMFFQAYSNSNEVSPYNSDNLCLILRVQCRIINGSNDSLILDRNLTFNIYKQPAPPGQVVLTRLPVYPPAFVKAFDSIATWLFAAEPVSHKSVMLPPACVFSDSGYKDQPLTQLEFANDDTSLQLLTQPSFSFNIQAPDYRKTATHKNIGGNAASGTLTLLTGVDFGKRKTKNYSADFPFETGADTFHCIVNYTEVETADRERKKNDEGYYLESGKYSVAERYTDPGSVNAITSGADTLAIFSITYVASNERASYTRLWDGKDSNTITPLPKAWNNIGADANVIITGTIQEDPFKMQSSRERCIKDFFVNGKLALSVYGKTMPAKALLFQQLSPMQMKLFTVLSSLPYSSFNDAVY